MVARNKNVLKDPFIKMEKETSKINLEVNEARIKYVKVSTKEFGEIQDLNVDQYCF